MTLVPSILDSHLFVHMPGHYDHSVSCILGKGILFFRLYFEQLLPFDLLHPVGFLVRCGDINMLSLVVVVEQLLRASLLDV
jgi:hypothetical protein